MKVFLVEDDQILNEAVSSALEGIGFEVDSFFDGQSAFDNISNKYQVFLIDVNLPYINGLELVKRIKKYNTDAKVFILSADLNIDTIMTAYDIGCDDYLKKPFDIRELLAKIDIVKKEDGQKIKLYKNCEYDLEKQIFFYNSKDLKLTKKENLLLHILVSNIGKTVENDKIERYVWEEDMGSGYVRQLVAKLRKKLPYDIIQNHAGNGYRIEKYKGRR